MADEKSKTFPEISSKLSALPKKSLFERQKAEAEAKRARERAETAAVYEDFVKSFEDDAAPADGAISEGKSKLGIRNTGYGGGPAKRHFTSSGPRMSGPGTLGPAPSSLSRKRNHEGLQPFSRNREYAQGTLGYDNSIVGPTPASAFRTSGDDDAGSTNIKEAERAAAKPTMYLASLPPGTSQSVVKALIPKVLTVDNVKFLRPSGQAPTDRKSVSAIVTLASDSAASDIDSSVSALQSRYLGWGYYLSISRHLSSAAIGSTVPVGLSSSGPLPFGAKTITPDLGGRLNRAPPPGLHRVGFAPPSSYGPPYNRSGLTTLVEVQPPTDLKQLKLIHKTLENLLNFGPEFEALLMSRPEVQREEKWAWLWDARSPGGVYYRWRLWDVITNSHPKGSQRGRSTNSSPIFEGGATWVPPERYLPFEFATRLNELVSDEDYDSSDEELSDGEDDRWHHGPAPSAETTRANNEGRGHMNPLKKAKLAHLLARLPTTHAKLRKGDVARVTAFAIKHAGAGADEVVEMIVSNIVEPYAYTRANPGRELEKGFARREQRGDDAIAVLTDRVGKEKLDTSSAKLVGLYLVSDILSSSATSGVRHAWRYRQLFESALKAHKVFEHLGRLEKELSWGRLRAEKWKRSINSLLHLWEGWCVFPQSSQEHLFQVFENPPLTREEVQEEKEKAEADQASAAFSRNKSRWKAVDEDLSAALPPEANPMGTEVDQVQGDMDVDGEPTSDIDGEPMEDSDLEVAQREASDEDEEGKGKVLEEGAKLSEQPEIALKKPSEPPAAPVRKPRPRAEDMFADSDSE
ncbi:SWAP/Surp domain-containing protein [Aspergillus lucknowensis]|uniref:CID domain-containing protein n=1 Tax=Aspergillus lucknowensis TaxID=176173 RepID=A0ABR4LUW1_9EURO